jgi:mannose-6-phosphate isomerase-like protein (cupin superfamily)
MDRDRIARHAAAMLEPVHTPHGEGDARWWFACLADIKISADQTGGALSVLEITEPPNEAGPLHVHHREDEGFWILEGSATFLVGDTRIEAGAGDFVWGPRGVPHAYTTGDAGCRMLYIMTPGGFEDLVREMSVPAAERTVAPPMDDEPDWEHVAAVAVANGCELLGPAPV